MYPVFLYCSMKECYSLVYIVLCCAVYTGTTGAVPRQVERKNWVFVCRHKVEF